MHDRLSYRRDGTERPACGSGTTVHSYNTGLHVAALFLILFLSILACSFPIVVRRFPGLKIPHHTLFLSRHFGSGIVLASAFVHLLPSAYISLTDPCLPRFWTDIYPAMAGFIAMLSVFVTVGVEMFFAVRGAGHSHDMDFTQLGGSESISAPPRRFRQMPIGIHEDTTALLPAEDDVPSSSKDKPLPQTPPTDDSESDLELNELEEETHTLTHRNGAPKHARQTSFVDAIPSHSQAHEERLVLQCLLLEAGILFHSVFIGMALSVATGSTFAVLLVAISFHQTFEGLALGSRIASIPSFSTTSYKPWLMSFMYGVTTPIGQAIGLALHGLYDPASELGLLMVGIVNAISTGLLLYAGLVQLIAEDFLSDRSYIELTGSRRIQACISVFTGAMLMSLVGAFA